MCALLSCGPQNMQAKTQQINDSHELQRAEWVKGIGVRGRMSRCSHERWDTGNVENVTARAQQQERNVSSHKPNTSFYENASSSYQSVSPATFVDEMPFLKQVDTCGYVSLHPSDREALGHIQQSCFDSLVGKQEGNLTLNEGHKVGNSNHIHEQLLREQGRAQRARNIRATERHLFKRLKNVLRCSGNISKESILHVALQELIMRPNEA